MIWQPINSHDGSLEHLKAVAEWQKRPHRAMVVRWSQAGYEQRERERAIEAFFVGYFH